MQDKMNISERLAKLEHKIRKERKDSDAQFMRALTEEGFGEKELDNADVKLSVRVIQDLKLSFLQSLKTKKTVGDKDDEKNISKE